MIRAPALAAIHAAELRVAQSRQNTRASLHRTRVAARATLARPGTLALIAVGAGLLGFWLARRSRSPSRRSSPRGESTVATPSAAGLLAAFMMRYGMQHLPFILQQFTTAVQRRGAAGSQASGEIRQPFHAAAGAAPLVPMTHGA